MTLIAYKTLTIHAAPTGDAGQALNANFVVIADFIESTVQEIAALDFYSTGEVDTLLASKAEAEHNHDAAYAPLLHDHDGVYAPVAHTHEGYASLEHDHNSLYASLDHRHDDTYSPLGHHHDEAYAALDHDHSGVYAAANHTHDGFALVDHNHDDIYSPLEHDHHGTYAPADHTHTAEEVGSYSYDEINNLFAVHVAVFDPHGSRAYTDQVLSAHMAAVDPHGDRAHAASLIAALTTADVGAYSISDVDTLLAAKAAADHDHDNIYSSVDHTHSEYAAADHTHDAVYAALDHDHAGVYSPIGHTHTAADVGAYPTSQVYTQFEVEQRLWEHVIASDPHGDRAHADALFEELSGSFHNYLINGGFQFFQRTAPGTLTTINDGGYGPDRWVVLSQDTTQCQRIAIEDGYAARLKRTGAGTGKFGLLQALEHQNTRPLRGKNVCFQAKLRCSAETEVRLALLAWNGTADSPAKDVVNNWNSDLLTVGNFFHSTSLSLVGPSSGAIGGPDLWMNLSATGTVPADANNLFCVVWLNSGVDNAATFDVTQCSLHLGTAPTTWAPRLYQAELSLCQRYYEKSFWIDHRPTNQQAHGSVVAKIYMTGTYNYLTDVRFKVPKRTTPSIAYYNPVADLGGRFHNYTRGWNQPASANFMSESGFATYSAETTNAGDELWFHWAANAEI